MRALVAKSALEQPFTRIQCKVSERQTIISVPAPQERQPPGCLP